MKGVAAGGAVTNGEHPAVSAAESTPEAKPTKPTKVKGRQPFAKAKRRQVTSALRAEIRELFLAGSSEGQIMRRTQVPLGQVRALIHLLEGEQDRKLAALIKGGVVMAPDREREPLPALIQVEGGLSDIVLTDRR
jgi:hypothetical protein